MTLFVTVPHAGTMDTIRAMRWEVYTLGERPTAPVAFAHLEDEQMEAIMAYEGPVVTTYRPIGATRDSWQRRYGLPNNLDGYLRNYQKLMARQPYVIHLGARPWR